MKIVIFPSACTMELAQLAEALQLALSIQHSEEGVTIAVGSLRLVVAQEHIEIHGTTVS